METYCQMNWYCLDLEDSSPDTTVGSVAIRVLTGKIFCLKS